MQLSDLEVGQGWYVDGGHTVIKTNEPIGLLVITSTITYYHKSYADVDIKSGLFFLPVGVI